MIDFKRCERGAEGLFYRDRWMFGVERRISEKIAKNAGSFLSYLVVDDDDFFCSFFGAVLSSAGMHVKTVCTDPSQILDAMKKFKPELVSY